jgi:hypothetical protein
MVEVQMRQHHVLDARRVQAGGPHLLGQLLSAHHLGVVEHRPDEPQVAPSIVPHPRAEPGVEHDQLGTVLDHERGDVEAPPLEPASAAEHRAFGDPHGPGVEDVQPHARRPAVGLLPVLKHRFDARDAARATTRGGHDERAREHGDHRAARDPEKLRHRRWPARF